MPRNSSSDVRNGLCVSVCFCQLRKRSTLYSPVDREKVRERVSEREREREREEGDKEGEGEREKNWRETDRQSDRDRERRKDTERGEREKEREGAERKSERERENEGEREFFFQIAQVGREQLDKMQLREAVQLMCDGFCNCASFILFYFWKIAQVKEPTWHAY